MQESAAGIAETKEELNPDRMESVNGGAGGGTSSQDKTAQTEKHFCKKCNKMQVFIAYSGTRTVCSVCNTPYTVS